MGFNKYELWTLNLAFILCCMPLEDKPFYFQEIYDLELHRYNGLSEITLILLFITRKVQHTRLHVLRI